MDMRSLFFLFLCIVNFFSFNLQSSQQPLKIEPGIILDDAPVFDNRPTLDDSTKVGQVGSKINDNDNGSPDNLQPSIEAQTIDPIDSYQYDPNSDNPRQIMQDRLTVIHNQNQDQQDQEMPLEWNSGPTNPNNRSRNDDVFNNRRNDPYRQLPPDEQMRREMERQRDPYNRTYEPEITKEDLEQMGGLFGGLVERFGKVIKETGKGCGKVGRETGRVGGKLWREIKRPFKKNKKPQKNSQSQLSQDEPNDFPKTPTIEWPDVIIDVAPTIGSSGLAPTEIDDSSSKDGESTSDTTNSDPKPSTSTEPKVDGPVNKKDDSTPTDTPKQGSKQIVINEDIYATIQRQPYSSSSTTSSYSNYDNNDEEKKEDYFSWNSDDYNKLSSELIRILETEPVDRSYDDDYLLKQHRGLARHITKNYHDIKLQQEVYYDQNKQIERDDIQQSYEHQQQDYTSNQQILDIATEILAKLPGLRSEEESTFLEQHEDIVNYIRDYCPERMRYIEQQLRNQNNKIISALEAIEAKPYEERSFSEKLFFSQYESAFQEFGINKLTSILKKQEHNKTQNEKNYLRSHRALSQNIIKKILNKQENKRTNEEKNILQNNIKLQEDVQKEVNQEKQESYKKILDQKKNLFTKTVGSSTFSNQQKVLSNVRNESNRQYENKVLNRFTINQNLHVGHIHDVVLQYANILQVCNQQNRGETESLGLFCSDLIDLENIYVNLMKDHMVSTVESCLHPIGEFFRGVMNLFGPHQENNPYDIFTEKFNKSIDAEGWRSSSILKCINNASDHLVDILWPYLNGSQDRGNAFLQQIEQRNQRNIAASSVIVRLLHDIIGEFNQNQMIRVLNRTLEAEHSIGQGEHKIAKRYERIAHPLTTIFNDTINKLQQRLTNDVPQFSDDMSNPQLPLRVYNVLRRNFGSLNQQETANLIAVCDQENQNNIFVPQIINNLHVQQLPCLCQSYPALQQLEGYQDRPNEQCGYYAIHFTRFFLSNPNATIEQLLPLLNNRQQFERQTLMPYQNIIRNQRAQNDPNGLVNLTGIEIQRLFPEYLANQIIVIGAAETEDENIFSVELIELKIQAFKDGEINQLVWIIPANDNTHWITVNTRREENNAISVMLVDSLGLDRGNDGQVMHEIYNIIERLSQQSMEQVNQAPEQVDEQGKNEGQRKLKRKRENDSIEKEVKRESKLNSKKRRGITTPPLSSLSEQQEVFDWDIDQSNSMNLDNDQQQVQSIVDPTTQLQEYAQILEQQLAQSELLDEHMVQCLEQRLQATRQILENPGAIIQDPIELPGYVLEHNPLAEFFQIHPTTPLELQLHNELVEVITTTTDMFINHQENYYAQTNAPFTYYVASLAKLQTNPEVGFHLSDCCFYLNQFTQRMIEAMPQPLKIIIGGPLQGGISHVEGSIENLQRLCTQPIETLHQRYIVPLEQAGQALERSIMLVDRYAQQLRQIGPDNLEIEHHPSQSVEEGLESLKNVAEWIYEHPQEALAEITRMLLDWKAPNVIKYAAKLKQVELIVHAIEKQKEVVKALATEKVAEVGKKLAEPIKTVIESGWSMPEKGRFINGRWYTQHALERMAPDTIEVRAILSRRAIKRGHMPGSDEFLDYVNPRGIPPSVVEDAIQNGIKKAGRKIGTIDCKGPSITVIIDEKSGNVVTIIPK